MTAIRTFAAFAAILAATTGPALAQGMFQFSNIGLPGRPPITVQTIYEQFSPGGFVGEVVGDPVPITGSNWGTIQVPFLSYTSPAVVQVRAWDRTASVVGGDDVGYDLSYIRGSTTFTIDQLGGGGAPPTIPAAMTGFHGLQIVNHVTVLVPEPPDVVLLGVGMLAGVWIVRRRPA